MPVTVGKMIPSQYEYFGSEQHDADMKEIVADQTDPVHIIGQVVGSWESELDTAVALARKDLYTEREEHHDYLYVTPVTGSTPNLAKIASAIGFTSASAQVQMQRPGSLMPRHQDPAANFANPYRIQVLVALAPWEYGQYLFFNNTVVREWSVGDVIYTDFSNVWHSTANMSWHTRPLLQIIGTPSEQLQQILTTNKKHVFQL